MKSIKLILLMIFALGGSWAFAQNDCSGTWTDAAEGDFVDGFTYSLSYADNNVILEVELIDPKDGLVAFAQTYNPDFAEVQMTNTGGQAFTQTFTGQTPGATFIVAIKFAFAGGLATSTPITYIVNEGCDNNPPIGALDLPIDFEDTELDYGLADFEGAVSTLVIDPTNAGNRVVETLKTTGSPFFAGTTVASGIGFTDPLPFTAEATTMSVRVWSPQAGIPVRLKVEALNDPTISVETEAIVSEANVWQTLIFDFDNEAFGTAALNLASDYQKASIFFNFGTNGEGFTYYWDDVDFGDGTINPPAEELDFPVTFEDEIDYGIVDFGGNASELIVDPTDATNMVMQSVKTAAAELWAGTTVGEGIGFAEPFPFTTSATSMSVRVWSPLAGIPIRLKAENLTNPTISVETEATVTEAGVWQTLTFNFANEAAGTAALNLANVYTKVSIFFNFGTTGAASGEQTYYWDDIEFLPVSPPADLVNLPVTFEDATLDYGLTDFGGNASEIVVDPTDPNNMVAQTLKTPGSEVWAGTSIAGGVGFETPIPFVPGSTQMTVRVWSPNAGTPVRLKVEDVTNGTISVEAQVNTTAASEWETLVFDFSNPIEGPALNFSNTYNLASIFFNFGTAGTGLTYYWDDVEFSPGEPAEGLDLPITFEDELIDYMLTDFEGAASEIVADPTNPANTVAQTVKTNTAAPWAGTTIGGDIGFANPIPFTADATTMSVKVWSPTSGTPVRLKVEQSFVPTVSVETEAVTTVAGEWETLVFDFANEATGTAELNLASSYNKASIFFNFGTEGAVAGEQTYYWDDVEFGSGSVVVTSVFGIIAESPEHTVLEDLIVLAGLDGTLSGEGTFTVFAPTDDAFALLSPDLVAALTSDPSGQLTQVLLYHVLGTEVMSGDLTDGLLLATLQTENLVVTISGDDVMINNAMVTVADLQADNGVVHVIDAVLIPTTVGVEYLQAADHNIHVGPNPATDLVNISFGEELSSPTFLMVYDINGKLVRQEQIQSQFSQITTADLRSGTYVLRIHQGDTHFFQKLIIAK